MLIACAAILVMRITGTVLRSVGSARRSQLPTARFYGKYLDTELTPEEIDMDHEAAETLRQLCRGYDLGRLVNLAEADKAGRVVVRPYRIDAAVYMLVKDEAVFYPETNGWYIGKENIGAITQDGFYLGNPEEGSFEPNDEIGKTVFLTCEEAEAALEAKRDG